ncbi:E3 ubiquitin-protein ligase RNF14-like [Copidosoma floridanum]|uniref:E3 ubiquitin-protein ligase RNF14-like n=1 Tax=Copidosoma floridanum TaxID=29053 RepID=UPI0006C9D512|nr:E3 ubiquitin-protein ligase RNF14-like [Copidosoma floridanum]XP_014218742.1 E3 ubiquitin-protein ligase RNF14-like [Copidosoma floridanum]XP_014218747.1 E3 ubiquitin-protein ligase RNF14-like [Copidosoma floridanum]
MDEQQADEILALKSIYNEEEFTHHIVDGHNKMTLKIFISLPENYFFTYNEQEDSNKVQSIKISHLPPLTLHIMLPKDYPSVSPPKYVLRSSWLKKNLMLKLCKKLNRLWRVNVGQEIIFTWINFLQTETLQFLHIEESVDIDCAYKLYNKSLGNAQKSSDVNNTQSAKEDCKNSELNINRINEKPVDPLRKGKKLSSKNRPRKSNKYKDLWFRLYLDITPGINPVKMLIDYNRIRNEIEFRKSFFSCKICFTDKSGEYCEQFKPCEHIFCKECIKNYFVSKIQEGDVQDIRCPNEDCSSKASPHQIKDLVEPEFFSKYDTILLNNTLDTMSDIIYCPRKICQYPVSREQNEIMAKCPVCEYTFCILCKALYHGVEPCKVDSDTRKNLVEEYQKASVSRKIELEQRYGKKQLQTCVENVMSESWIEKNSQNCPKCNCAIEKSDGCNKMTCWKCNTYFCWICKVRILSKDPYDHYNNPQSECYKKLYAGLYVDEDDDVNDEEDDSGGEELYWPTDDEEDDLHEFYQI